MVKIKILFLLSLLLNFYLTNSQQDIDMDLTLEDEPNGSGLNKEAGNKRVKYVQDESDEFDNPVLLENTARNAHHSHKVHNIPQNVQEVSAQVQDGDKPPMFAYYELFMVTFLILYLINCYIGKRSNTNLAEQWYSSNKTFFEENYAHIGGGTEYNPQTLSPIIKDSYSGFKFYASGRVFTKWMLVNMDFKKRHDLISILSSAFLFGEKDKIVYETSLAPANELPIVFCMCRKKDVKTMRKNYSDISHFTEPASQNYVSDANVLLSEDTDMFDEFFNNKAFLTAYKKVENYIDIIYFTDRQTYSKEPYAIFFSFEVNTSKSDLDEVFLNLTTFVHTLIDLLCVYKISPACKRESEKKRMEYEKVRAKELTQKSQDEPKSAKTDVKTNKPLTREQAQKLDEKEKKESLKNQKKRMMKVVKK